MSAQRISYWNSRMNKAHRLTRENSNVTVKKFKCGCRIILEHSDLAHRKEQESCGNHEGEPAYNQLRLIERFV